MATHWVILASLASQVLALFLDRKVSTPPAMAPGQARALAGLEHDHGDQDQAAQKLNDGEGELHINIVPFRPVQTGEKSKMRRKIPDAMNIIPHIGRKIKDFSAAWEDPGKTELTAGRWPQSPPAHPWAGGPPGRQSGRGRAPGRTGRRPRSWRRSRSYR